MQQWAETYDATHERHGEYARSCAERFRLLLGDDLIVSGEAVSIAYTAVWKLAGEVLHRRVQTSERGLLVEMIRRATIQELRSELKCARPQAIEARRYAQRLRKLEDEITERKSVGSPMSDDEETERRADLERSVALGPHREYPKDDSVAVACRRRGVSEQVAGGVSAAEMVAQILSHPWMAEGSRQRYAFLQLLVHEGEDVDGQVWEAMGWNVRSCRVLLVRVKRWVIATFPEAGELVA